MFKKIDCFKKKLTEHKSVPLNCNSAKYKLKKITEIS